MIQTMAKVEQDLNQAARHEPLSIFPDFSVSVCLSVSSLCLCVSISQFLYLSDCLFADQRLSYLTIVLSDYLMVQFFCLYLSQL